jgi:hypothetical protein
MKTAVAREPESHDQGNEERPALGLASADAQHEERDDHSIDATQGRQIGSDLYDDATQGRQIGSRPYEDATQARAHAGH